jgi:hypothetical protein
MLKRMLATDFVSLQAENRPFNPPPILLLSLNNVSEHKKSP